MQSFRILWLGLLVALLGAGCSKTGATARRYVFIDGGAHLGETVQGFEQSVLFTKHPWSVISFEPNAELAPQIPPRPFLTVRQEAIWTKDGPLEFKVQSSATAGGTVVDSPVAKDVKPIEVKAIDFSQWLKNTYTKDDVVYLKLDIEMAEYPVLEHMLKEGTMGLVDRLYVEFHGVQRARLEGASNAQVAAVEKHDRELIEAITGAGAAISLHTPDEPAGEYFGFDPQKYGQSW